MSFSSPDTKVLNADEMEARLKERVNGDTQVRSPHRRVRAGRVRFLSLSGH